MTSLAKPTTVNLISCLTYRDANAAVDWLATTFGFEKHAVYKNDAGQVEHAQLTFGIGMIMIGPKRDTAYGRLIKQPDEIGGFETQSVYVIVTDADAIYARAKAAGAEIVTRHQRRRLRRPRLLPAATSMATSGTSAPTTRGRMLEVGRIS